MTTFKRDFQFDENFMIKISNNIKKYRIIAGITQEQLAVDVGKSYDFIRRLEYKKWKIGCSGVQDYLRLENFDGNVNEEFIHNLIENINKEIDDNYSKHTAIKHYKDTYNFIPPFVLTKILTFGVISRYYGLLKQNDRQDISKYFKISDKLLKQILANLTMIRNISL